MKRDLETIKRKNQNPHDEEVEDFKAAAKKRNVKTPTRGYPTQSRQDAKRESPRQM